MKICYVKNWKRNFKLYRKTWVKKNLKILCKEILIKIKCIEELQTKFLSMDMMNKEMDNWNLTLMMILKIGYNNNLNNNSQS